MRKYKKLALFCMVFIVTLMLINSPIAAEVGNSGGFGGSSGGGSSSGGGFGGLGSFIYLGGTPGLIIFIIIIVAVKLYSQNKGGNNNRGYRGNGTPYQSSSPVNETSTIEKIKEQDPNFSAEKFRGFVGELYITLQEAWEARDWKAVRPFESNALFNMHNRQLQEHIDKGWTNHLDRQDVRKVELTNYHIDGDQEVLTVRLHAFCVDYTTDDNTGKVIDGDQNRLQERYYRFEFIRSVGVKTDSDTGLNPTNCPNCGAPTQVTSSGECEYCHSVITNGKYGWVLNKYGAW